MAPDRRPEQLINPAKKTLVPFAQTLATSTDELVKTAYRDAILSTSGSPDANLRVKNGLERRLGPFLEESWVIADRLQSPEYQQHVEETSNFINARLGFIVCPDGRIVALSLGDPLVANIHRWLKGMPETRDSTRRDTEPVLDDPYLSSSLGADLLLRREMGQNPEAVENVAPHIHSLRPEHGCGACMNEMRSGARFLGLAMKFGGIPEYFDELGENFFAFNNNGKRVGGTVTTFDTIHDAYNQSLIVGVRAQYKNFDHNLSLRENLLKFESEGKILMTETLDGMVLERVRRFALSRGLRGNLDLKDPSKFDTNAILIGEVARQITEEEGQRGFNWIPSEIRENITETAVNVLAYSSIRNSAYRILGGIRAGSHDFEDHREDLVTTGPSSATFNINRHPLIQKTHPILTDRNIADTLVLTNLLGSVLSERGVDLSQEARVVVATGEFDPDVFKDPMVVRRQFNQTADIVRQNVAKLRNSMMSAVRNGEVVVVGAILNPDLRKVIAMV